MERYLKKIDTLFRSERKRKGKSTNRSPIEGREKSMKTLSRAVSNQSAKA